MRLTNKLCALSVRVSEQFSKYATFAPTPLSLKRLSAFGKEGDIVKSTRFLKFELPVRIANILQEIHLLPKKLLATPSASLVTSWYEKSFTEMIDYEEMGFTEKECADYLIFLDKSIQSYDNVVETMACGVMEMQEAYGIDTAMNAQIQYFLDRFYTMRISIRMLVSQHLLVFGPELNKHRRFIGCIDQHCDVVEILKDAYNDAKMLCDHYYADSPEMNITLSNAVDGSIKFVYVPSHLYHILFELLKNALRAVVEKARSDKRDVFPPVDVLIVNGKENVTLRIADRGGGFPRSFADALFGYTYTTAGTKGTPLSSGLSGNAPLAGYGYGLPLSRLYARYLHGDLTLSGLEGYGTEAFVYMMRRDSEADEVLPVFNRTSARRYETSRLTVGDWSHKPYSSAR